MGRHKTGHFSPTGRGTRGYIALELPGTDPRKEPARLCFLKDYWRPVHERIHTELQTYEHLRQNDVSHVATAIAGGDVLDTGGREQTTRAQERRQAEAEPPLPRQHFRVVTKEIGRPLEDFEGFTQLVWYVSDALIGTLAHPTRVAQTDATIPKLTGRHGIRLTSYIAT